MNSANLLICTLSIMTKLQFKLIHNQAVFMHLPFVDLNFRRAAMSSKLSLKLCCHYNQAKRVINMWYLIVVFFFRFLCNVSCREFTRLMYGLLGNKRIPLPPCAYHAVRKTFIWIMRNSWVTNSDVDEAFKKLYCISASI